MAVASSVSRRLVLVVALTVLSQVGSAQAQDVATPSQVPAETSAQTSAPPSPSLAPSAQKAGQNQGGRRAAETPATQGVAEQHKLPPDSTTKQTLELPGRSLAFTATAGSIRLFDQKGEPQADIAYTSYQLDGTDPATRPVTFVFNGGPGAASAWLQLGNSGPWRLSINADSVTPSASPDLKPNAETWLDFTDLVYIDPVGTGYSRFVATGDEVRKRFFSVDGDVASVALVIRRWLEKHDRLLSPKYVVGESYGGIRGPKVVRNLQRDQGIGVRGLILISPVLDFREFTGSSMLQYVWSLPTYAAVARRAKGKAVTRADMTDVESYATSDFLIDLIKGQADVDANNRLSDKVAELTGIDQAVSRRLAGRFDVAEFRREFDRRNGRITGRYDASVMGPDPNPDFELFFLQRSFGRGPCRAGVERRRRSHHAQAQLASRRLLSVGQQRSGAGVEFWTRHQSTTVGRGYQADHGDRPEAESAGRSWAVRSRDALFRQQGHPRPDARDRRGATRQARGLSRRSHVLFARRLTPGLPRRRAGDDEIGTETARRVRVQGIISLENCSASKGGLGCTAIFS